MDRISNLNPPEKNLATQTLGWIAVAARQLTIREVEDASALYHPLPYSAKIVPGEDRPFRSKICSVCGALVEISKDTIFFVHHTVKTYVVSLGCSQDKSTGESISLLLLGTS